MSVKLRVPAALLKALERITLDQTEKILHIIV